MQIFDQTGAVSQFTMGMDPDGREHVSLVVKGTLDFPIDDQTPMMRSAIQMPLTMADEYFGEPGFSAPRWETDFAFRKHKCDIILNGFAYAPNGRPKKKVITALKVGAWSKSIEVFGHREWLPAGPIWRSTDPLPFQKLQISYDNAFGGTDRLDPEDELPHAYLDNPVGRGWAHRKNNRRIPGLPLPNTQEPGEDISSPFGTYRPMSFGPIPRNVPSRLKYAGTYDQAWIDDVFPFLPCDFDERYYQSAPEDQQIPFPEPGTRVSLYNLTPKGEEHFHLPQIRLPIKLFKGREVALDRAVLPDTLLIDAEARKLSLVWRIDAPIKRTILDYTEAWIGRPTDAMVRARREGRTYIRDVATGEADA